MRPEDGRDALATLWRDASMPEDALGWTELTGTDPVLPSSFALGMAAQASVAAAGLAAAELWRLRGGTPQAVRVDMQHAAAEFRSDRHLRVDGAAPKDPWDPSAGLYPAQNGWVRLHTAFPHHRDGVLRLLGVAPPGDKAVVAAALRDRDALAFETEATEAGMCVAALRSFAEWDASPQGQAVPGLPLVAIERIGDAPPEPLPFADRPLAGIRVLDLTRVLAGPVCGRTLAAHGAEVMRVTAPHLPDLPNLDTDTGRGKLSAAIDLRARDGRARDGRARDGRAEDGRLEDGRAALAGLLRGADVFVQGYRPGGLARLGFAPEDTARLRPGIVHVSLSAYGHAGPWAERRGFDSLVQTATGFNVAEAEAAGQVQPRVLPAQALDYASGYLLAFGAMAALRRRALEGGSWLVRVALARTGWWLRNLPRVSAGFDCPDPGWADAARAGFLEESDSPFGRLTALRHPAVLTQTPAGWARPSVPLGTDPPVWPARERPAA